MFRNWRIMVNIWWYLPLGIVAIFGEWLAEKVLIPFNCWAWRKYNEDRK